MRDFSWKYFTLTGDVDAYMLYKAAVGQAQEEIAAGGERNEDEETAE
ncbi:YqzL family protein [Paenibacillus sp. JX-17]|uniref:YqzL family protein n=1 Tax=Paenibacillus lacisoli TaxID=3064525 RepID=A0ABT9C862_9BACL|nr:YqzL family protein [Paenibacillus sp. JX-17]MDO7905450.1 YqzL family protein [Paenibacillus sp. JX-17]